MTKGTSSFGKRGRTKSHGLCGRCGRRAFHYQKARCASCGFGKTAKLRHYNWALKSRRRHTTGTGRTPHLRYIISRAKVFKRVNEKYAQSVRAARIRALKKPIW